jgi:hypothetical protein
MHAFQEEKCSGIDGNIRGTSILGEIGYEGIDSLRFMMTGSVLCSNVITN